MANSDLRTTSVKIHPDVFERYQIASIKDKFNLQKLLNRSMDLYVKDEDFRKKIHNHIDLISSGSL